MLRTRFGIAPARVGLAYRVLMESAETAGFFATRGARTHLIIPSIGRTPTPPAKDEKNGSGGDNGAGAGGVTVGRHLHPSKKLFPEAVQATLREMEITRDEFQAWLKEGKRSRPRR